MNRYQHRLCLPLLIMLVSLLACQTLTAQQFQWPEKAKNLKVLPPETSAKELQQAMFSFVSALDVRCEHCHVGEAGQPLTEFDFAADARPAKETARIMLKMVEQINSIELAKLGKPTEALTQVRCATCHHGQPKPRMIEDVLTESIAGKGVDAAVERYRKLREKYYGGYVFDFGKDSLNTYAQKIAQKGQMNEAIALLKLNAEYHPEYGNTFFMLGVAYMQSGMKPQAIENLERAKELMGDEPQAVQRLDAMLQGLKGDG